jgi:hypothetical protein
MQMYSVFDRLFNVNLKWGSALWLAAAPNYSSQSFTQMRSGFRSILVIFRRFFPVELCEALCLMKLLD